MTGVTNEVLSFGDCRLDLVERRLTRGGQTLDVSGRYLDALRLLVVNAGSLVTKDRLLDEVWKGVPVTDEALTQCIRSLRRALGDDAARPRFIETVPRHGYRFIAPLHEGLVEAATVEVVRASPLLLVAAGLAGGALAGLVGGIGYGLLAATEPPAGTGAISILLVLTCICLLVGLLGGIGVGSGIAAARQLRSKGLSPLMLGGALGGLAVGALGRLIGLDAFALLVGSRPVQITGGSEGLLIGAFAGAAAWLALERRLPLERLAAAGAALGALAGLFVIIGGGQMMAGSLAVLASAHPEAPLGTLLGGPALASWVRLLAGAVEGAIFVGALALAFGWVARQPGDPRPPG